MRKLFSTKGASIDIYSNDPLIFKIDEKFYDAKGNLCKRQDYPLPLCSKVLQEDSNNPWNDVKIENLGIDIPLARMSDCEVVEDDGEFYGNFGFIDESGNYIIKPQYAYAYNFSHGLACINLKRTWYLENDGKYHYRNHYGYIDQNGRTRIEFAFIHAYPFNKYGIARAYDEYGCYFIDTEGNKICKYKDNTFENDSILLDDYYYSYNDRYIMFEADVEGDGIYHGLYDTKHRKPIFEALQGYFEELSENIVVFEDYFGYAKDIYYIDD